MTEELELEIVWCYCCEEFTEQEVYEGDEGLIYQCDCGCQIDSSEDEVYKEDDEEAYRKNRGRQKG